MAKRKMSVLAQAIVLCNALGPDEQRVVVDLLRVQLQPEKVRKAPAKQPSKKSKAITSSNGTRGKDAVTVNDLQAATGKSQDECQAALTAASGSKKDALLALTSG